MSRDNFGAVTGFFAGFHTPMGRRSILNYDGMKNAQQGCPFIPLTGGNPRLVDVKRQGQMPTAAVLCRPALGVLLL